MKRAVYTAQVLTGIAGIGAALVADDMVLCINLEQTGEAHNNKQKIS